MWREDMDNFYVRKEAYLNALVLSNDLEVKKALEKARIEAVLKQDFDIENKNILRDYNKHYLDRFDWVIIDANEDYKTYLGFCFAMDKPIYIIAREGDKIQEEISNKVDRIIFYEKPDDLVKPFLEINKNFPRIILASQSEVRKRQLIEESIPFEIIVSNADETPDESKNFRNQLADISMRKAMKVFDETLDMGLRLIIAADQNIVFEDVMYGKPKTLDEARLLIMKMMGSEEVYAYTGNAVLLAEGEDILQSINVTDVSRMSVDNITDDELEIYLSDGKCLTYCGGISISNSNFVHLKEGRMSTARGMTLEYAKELRKSLRR